jgi:hypothetical protein
MAWEEGHAGSVRPQVDGAAPVCQRAPAQPAAAGDRVSALARKP